jgi:uncharacterized membrane protein YphA (DoxX/SURF4 family)
MTPSFAKIAAALAQHRAHAIGLDVVRLYLGGALVVRGALFVVRPELLSEYLVRSGDWAWPFLLTHYVVLSHLGGGLLLLAGLATRFAALVQIPILLGAVFLVHFQDGLLRAGQSLEFSGLVLFLLVVFAVLGSGPLSADAALRLPREKRSPSQSVVPVP